MTASRLEESYGEQLYQLDAHKILCEVKSIEKHFSDRRKHMQTMIKVLFSLITAQALFERSDATSLFIYGTKLFQFTDHDVRRVLYLLISELAKNADDILISFSSIIQEISGRDDSIIKADALRALSAVTDISFLSGAERVLRQSLLDSNNHLKSESILAILALAQHSKESVKKIASESFSLITSTTSICQYHASVLAFFIRDADRNSLLKLIKDILYSTSGANFLASAFALKIYHYIVEKDGDKFVSTPHIDLRPFLRLKGKFEAISLQACKIILSAPNLFVSEMSFAISALKSMLSSKNSIVKFSALKAISEYANNPLLDCSSFKVELEGIISEESNKLISSIAIAILLKNGDESSIEILLTKLFDFSNSGALITDDFRINILNALVELCSRYPRRSKLILDYLGKSIRDEGGFIYKKSAILAISDLMKIHEKIRDNAFTHITEFIEDSSDSELTILAISVLGNADFFKNVSLSTLSLTIRCVANRIILEESNVRVAAIVCLAKIAFCIKFDMNNASKKFYHSIIQIISNCIFEFSDDNNTRNTAIFYLSVLNDLPSKFARDIIFPDQFYKLEELQEKLGCAIQDKSSNNSLIELSDLPCVSVEELIAQKSKESNDSLFESPLTTRSSFEIEVNTPVVSKIPEESKYGFKIHSSKPVLLTDEDSDYEVFGIKHLFERHVIFEFTCRNTVPNFKMRNVYVDVDLNLSELIFDNMVQIDELLYDSTLSCFSIFKFGSMQLFDQHPEIVSNNYFCFSTTVGQREKYAISSLIVSFSDYVVRAMQKNVNELRFNKIQSFELTAFNNLKEAAAVLKDLFGCAVFDSNESLESYSFCITGLAYPNQNFWVLFELSLVSDNVFLKLNVKGDSENICNEIISLIS